VFLGCNSASTDRGFSQWVNAGFGGYWVKFRFLGLLIEVEGVLALEIGASAGLGYGDRGSTPVLGGY
jgi:hypothetical protein